MLGRELPLYCWVRREDKLLLEESVLFRLANLTNDFVLVIMTLNIVLSFSA